MANVQQLPDIISLCRDASITLMIWGPHGVGKSSIVHQFCANNEMECVNMRLSQMEAADIRGLPDKENGRTKYLPPSELPRDGAGILFLDESFRAADDVQQAVFELVLDRKVGEYRLPEGWSVVCANNYMEGDYILNTFQDAAFLDRFCHVQLYPEVDSWAEWMSSVHGAVASEIIEFAAATKENFSTGTGDLGFSILPSPRSWDMVARVLTASQLKNYNKDVKLEVIGGLIGTDAAMAFMELKSPIKPQQLIKDGVAAHTKTLKGLDRNQIVALTWGLKSYITPKIEEDVNKFGGIALDFAEWVINNTPHRDVITGYLAGLVSNGKSEAGRISLINTKVAAIINDSKKKRGKTDLLTLLEKRPELQKLISQTVWGQ